MKKQSKTDWAKIKAMKDRDIDLSDAPELDEDFFAGAIRAASMPPSAATWKRISAG
jgi:hypothetical protein